MTIYAGKITKLMEGLVETLKDFFWFKHVFQPTWGRGTSNPSLLDLVLTNDEGMISDMLVGAPLGKSDQSVIFFYFNAYVENDHEKNRYKYDKGDYESMRD